MKTRALIFDMDGTMIDSMGHHRQAWILFAQRHGVTMEADEIMRRTTGRTGVECMQQLFGETLDHARALALVDEKESIYRESFGAEFREVRGFRAFARQAAVRGLRIGVGTAGDRHNVAFAMGHLSMQPSPTTIVGGDEGFAGKPDPAIFLEVARRLAVSPTECVVFEDAPFGIEAARRAGMKAVAVCSSHTADELDGPHVLAAIEDYEDLERIGFLNRMALLA